MPPHTAAAYRACAEECEQLAATATRPETRETMIYLAHRWRMLAAEESVRKSMAEELERLTRAQDKRADG
jgi:hypothetical protein